MNDELLRQTSNEPKPESSHIDKLEQGHAEIMTKLDNLEVYLQAIRHRQNERRKLLMAIDEKLTRFENISEIREERL